jgi:hypothetical protein
MMDRNDIKKTGKTEEAFYNSVDGLGDITLGLVIILAASSVFFKLLPYTTIVFLLIFQLIKTLRERITYPRIGYAKYKGSEKKMRISSLVSLSIGSLIFILFIYLYRTDIDLQDTLRGYMPLILGVFFGIVVFSIGKTFYIRRFNAHSILVFFSFVLIFFIDREYAAPAVLISCGAVILISGTIIFIRFIRKNPRLSEENENDKI